jgi:cytoplasmic iron level regulating protein YaaA (DUF328/UPF0246 family)
LDFESDYPKNIETQILFPHETEEVIKTLKSKTLKELKKIMQVSDSIAELNFDRYIKWDENKNIERPSLFAYNGDIYQELHPYDYTKSQLDYLQDHLRIISGVYGLIRPFDGMRPYRLEMKANLKIKSKRLYDFWRKTITDYLHAELQKTDGLLIDLASHEYSKVIEFKDLKAKRIKVEFRQIKGGKVLNMGIQDKIARGQMIDFMAKNLIKDPEKLKDFHTDGYEFEKRVGDELYFITKFVSRAKTPSAI